MNRIITVILVLVFLTACSSGSKKQADRYYYRFATATAVETASNIEVKRPTALGILGNRPMVAMNDQGALRQMNSNFWLESPKLLLLNYLKQKFPPSEGSDKPRIILSSEIRRLEKYSAEAFVAVHFTATNDKGELLLDRTIEQQLSSTDISIQSFADSVKKAIEMIINELHRELMNEA